MILWTVDLPDAARLAKLLPVDAQLDLGEAGQSHFTVPPHVGWVDKHLRASASLRHCRTSDQPVFLTLHVSHLKRFNVCALLTRRFGLTKGLSSFRFDASFSPFVLLPMSGTDDRSLSSLFLHLEGVELP